LKYVDNTFIGRFYFHDIKYLVKCTIPLNKKITIICFQMKKKFINNLLSITFIYKYIKDDMGLKKREITKYNIKVVCMGSK